MFGTLYAGHDILGDVIDVAMTASLGSAGAFDERIRDYGMVQKIFMQFGPNRWRFTSKERIALQGFTCMVRPRFTALVNAGQPWRIQETYQAIIHDQR